MLVFLIFIPIWFLRIWLNPGANFNLSSGCSRQGIQAFQLSGWMFHLHGGMFHLHSEMFHLHGGIFHRHGGIFHLHSEMFHLHGGIFHRHGGIFHLHSEMFHLHGEMFHLHGEMTHSGNEIMTMMVQFRECPSKCVRVCLMDSLFYRYRWTFGCDKYAGSRAVVS